MIPRVSPFLGLRWFSVRLAVLVSLASAPLVVAQAQNAGAPLNVTTFAGRAGERQATNATGTNARFSAPAGLAFDSAGNLYVADTSNNLFRRITAAGVVTTYAGTPIDREDHPINIGSADGAAASASFHIGEPGGNGPWGAPDSSTTLGSVNIAIDSAGTLYFADTLNYTIRKITSSGTVSTIAGAVGQEGSSDGAGADARFLVPYGVALDGAGNLYVADTGNNTIRKISPAGVVSTFAGLARSPGNTDGTGTAARFKNPMGIVVDSAGNVFVSDNGNHAIRKITPSGDVSTFAGLSGTAGSSDGSGTFARFNRPTALAIDAAGNLYVTDTGNQTIRRVTAARAVSTVAGAAGISGTADGTGNQARFVEPAGIAVNAAGEVFIADTSNSTIRKGTPVTGSSAPTLTVSSQPQRQQVLVNSTATFKVVATGSPAPSYQWQKAGADIAGATSATYTIGSAQFADAGLYSVIVTAGTISFTSTPAQLQVFPTGTQIPPINILAQPTDQEVFVGQPVTFTVEVSGVTSPTYQWKKDNVVIPGANQSSYTIGAAQTSDAGVYTLTVSENGNVASTVGATLTVNSATTVAPAISAQPQPQTANLGSTVTFSVTASGTPSPSYQWRFNGTPVGDGLTANGSSIAGATTSTLTLSNITAADAGSYSVTVSNSAGNATSNAAALTVNSIPPAPSRIVNLSILTSISGAGDSFTMGYVVGGAGTTGAKPLVIRAAGPSLGTLGVPNTLADPKMELFGANSVKLGENNDWGGSASVANAMAAVGAFGYISPTSKDAASVLEIPATNGAPSNNSVKVTANDNGSGTVIAEVYDATPNDAFTGLTPRLVNVSVLKPFGTSGFTIGFVIRGPTAKTVLIRAVGPGLAGVGVTSGFVADPQLTLFDAGTQAAIDTNNNWGGTATLSAAFTSVGAFNLPNTSTDAALLKQLQPGNYTVEVKPVSGTATGLGLVEVYEVP